LRKRVKENRNTSTFFIWQSAYLCAQIAAMDIITELLKQVKRAGSQQAAAAALGISAQYLNDLLRGRRDASEAILDKLGLRRIIVRAKKTPQNPS